MPWAGSDWQPCGWPALPDRQRIGHILKWYFLNFAEQLLSTIDVIQLHQSVKTFYCRRQKEGFPAASRAGTEFWVHPHPGTQKTRGRSQEDVYVKLFTDS